MTLPFLMTRVQTGKVNIAVFDETGLFIGNLEETSRLKITFIDGEIEELKNTFKEDYDALLHIPNFNIQYPNGITLYAEKQIGITIFSHLERRIEYIVERARFENAGIDRELIERLRASIRIESIIISETGEQAGNNAMAHVIGAFMGFCMYFIIFAYGGQVMQSVVNEKTNRIIEILVSSVRPIEIMIGKIIGIAGVALTQLLIWVILGSLIFAFFTVGIAPFLNVSHAEMDNMMEMQANMAGQNSAVSHNMVTQIVDFLSDPGAIHFPTIVLLFTFYFVFAYLFYSTLYAALGSLTDDHGQTNQYTIIVFIPVIVSMMIMVNVVDNPHSPLALWASIIPFSSPIVMLARLPFNVPTWQLILSSITLLLSFIASAWVSGKIYRTAILLYGKKLSWKDLWKFVRA